MRSVAPRPKIGRTGQTNVESAITFEIRVKVLPVVGASETGYCDATAWICSAVNRGNKPARSLLNCDESWVWFVVVSFLMDISVKM